ncbi:hypothetical protein CW304_25630 [Bacillus sp. UFRGS-B20]|nr:hypothetical protein CW304_25630 [Bacillus sp. UFRGS-B20]
MTFHVVCFVQFFKELLASLHLLTSYVNIFRFSMSTKFSISFCRFLRFAIQATVINIIMVEK